MKRTKYNFRERSTSRRRMGGGLSTIFDARSGRSSRVSTVRLEDGSRATSGNNIGLAGIQVTQSAPILSAESSQSQLDTEPKESTSEPLLPTTSTLYEDLSFGISNLWKKYTKVAPYTPESESGFGAALNERTEDFVEDTMISAAILSQEQERPSHFIKPSNTPNSSIDETNDLKNNVNNEIKLFNFDQDKIGTKSSTQILRTSKPDTVVNLTSSSLILDVESVNDLDPDEDSSVPGPPIDGQIEFTELDQNPRHHLLKFLYPDKFGEVEDLEPIPPFPTRRKKPIEYKDPGEPVGVFRLLQIFLDDIRGVKTKGEEFVPDQTQQPELLATANELVARSFRALLLRYKPIQLTCNMLMYLLPALFALHYFANRVSNSISWGIAIFLVLFDDETFLKQILTKAFFTPDWIIGNMLDHLLIAAAIGAYGWAAVHYLDVSTWRINNCCIKNYRFTRKSRWIGLLVLCFYQFILCVLRVVEFGRIYPELENSMRPHYRNLNEGNCSSANENCEPPCNGTALTSRNIESLNLWINTTNLYNCSGIWSAKDWEDDDYRPMTPMKCAQWYYDANRIQEEHPIKRYTIFYPPVCCYMYTTAYCQVCQGKDKFFSLWRYGCLPAQLIYGYAYYGAHMCGTIANLVAGLTLFFAGYCLEILIFVVGAPPPPPPPKQRFSIGQFRLLHLG